MHIKQVNITNFKSFKTETEISFKEGINIIVGPNSGGKSNLLELVQSFFNDVFFMDANFERNNDNNQKNSDPIKPFKGSQQRSDSNHLQRIFDKHINGSGGSEMKVVLSITQDDVENIKEFEKTIVELEQFEENKIGSGFIKQIKSSFDFSTDYEKYIDFDLPIVFTGGNNIQIDSSVKTSELNKVLHFLRWSRVLYKLAHFYKLINEKFELNVRPYFYYISPNRNFSLSKSEHIIELGQINASSTNRFTQRNANQETPSNNFDVLLRILVENFYASGKKTNKYNERFRTFLNKYLKLDFDIEVHGYAPESRYKVSFSKMNSSSWKLSSGEREFLNLISTVFSQKIHSGIIIIDEPELHLHPKWQHMFLDLLKDISNTRNIQIICVTHSASFIRRDLLANIIRVSMIEDDSQIYLPDQTQTQNTSVKDQFMLVTASNNERVFFADKIILVEGYADRIIFQAMLDKLYEQDKPIIEIVDVFGKGNFQRYQDFLSIWNIPTAVIADLDYLATVDNSAKNDVFSTDENKMLKKLGQNNSVDGISLIKILTTICDEKDSVAEEDKKSLCSLYQYLKLRHSSLVVTGTSQKIDSYIQAKKQDNLFLLSKGEIEDYFIGVGKFEIDSAIETAKSIRSNEITIDTELESIIQDIVAI